MQASAEITGTTRWRALEVKGAKPQRLLWASTGTKNPQYSDVLYVESLIGSDTITTVPPDTLKVFNDHGRISRTLGDDSARNARRVKDALANGGINFADVNHTLEEEGIEKFVKSFDTLLGLGPFPEAASARIPSRSTDAGRRGRPARTSH